ncbi:MAG: MBL fold metallo-hydrolase, partial [Gammaproteobacteria bacterium]|nr:MBL fold metallo-hydrolase [Gammaproteobacteria bacterium]
MVEIHTLQLGAMENFTYLIEDCATHQTAVVDPAWEVEKIIEWARQQALKITTILLTHGHHDHINGVKSLQQATGADVYLHQREAEFFNLEQQGYQQFSGHSSIRLGESTLLPIETPGHTPGGVCYQVDGHLFTGDTLFVFGCGRCDMDGGDPVQMYHSLQRLLNELDSETRIYPGHNYSVQPVSTLQQEREGNPFLHCEDESSFVRYRMVEHDQLRGSP